jgi:hypothetical protein
LRLFEVDQLLVEFENSITEDLVGVITNLGTDTKESQLVKDGLAIIIPLFENHVVVNKYL